jgi:hypothetical protein
MEHRYRAARQRDLMQRGYVRRPNDVGEARSRRRVVATPGLAYTNIVRRLMAGLTAGIVAHDWITNATNAREHPTYLAFLIQHPVAALGVKYPEAEFRSWFAATTKRLTSGGFSTASCNKRGGPQRLSSSTRARPTTR